MQYLMKYETWDYKKLHQTKTFTVYRGTDYDDPYSGDMIFFSVSRNFAEDYGKNIYKAEIQPTKIFDSFNEEHWKLLFEWCGRDGVEDPYNDITYYSFDEMVIDESDTWEIIEASMWAIPSDYDCILISEGGEINFIVLNDDIIIKSELLTEQINETKVNYLQKKFDREKIKGGLIEFKHKLKEEGGEYKETTQILKKFYKTGSITNEDGEKVKKQLIDTFKMIGLGGIFMIPGGSVGIIVLVKLAKRFGVNLLPSAWSKTDEIK